MNCSVCSSDDLVELHRFANGFRLYGCKRCGCGLTVPRPRSEDFALLYPPTYYGGGGVRFNRVMEYLVKVFRRRRADAIESFARKGKAVDIGCGRGLLPGILRERGWDAHGIEASPVAASHALSLGVPTIIGSFPECAGGLRHFDAAVLWHVLEHLASPRDAVRACNELLDVGGILAIAVPNFSSLQSRWTGRHWFHLDIPRHFHHFTPSALCGLMQQEGFSIRAIRYLSLEQNVYGWIQSLLNAVGFRHNLLYEVLKRPSARTVAHPLRDAPWQAISVCLLGALLLPLSLLLTTIEVALSRGGTFELYAEKVSPALRHRPG